MLELFMIASVDAADEKKARAVLKGLCGREGYESHTRSIRFQGPRRPNGLSNINSIPDKTPDQRGKLAPPPLWRELQTAVSNQSYLVELRYEIPYDGLDMQDLNQREGIVRFVDFPAPQGQVPKVIQQRKKVEIWNQKNLIKIMQDNNYALKGEIIEHTHQFFDDKGVEFCLSKQFYAYDPSLYKPMPTSENRQLATSLKPVSQLQCIDPMNRWFLYVKVHVLEDSKPDEVRAGHERLAQVKRDLEGAIAFKELDRRTWDTRVPLEQKSGPAPLPQVVTVSDN